MLASCKTTDCLAAPFFLIYFYYFFFFGTRFSLHPLVFTVHWLPTQLVRHVHCICSGPHTALCVGTVQPAYNKHSRDQKSVHYIQVFPSTWRTKEQFLATKCSSSLLCCLAFVIIKCLSAKHFLSFMAEKAEIQIYKCPKYPRTAKL